MMDRAVLWVSVGLVVAVSPVAWAGEWGTSLPAESSLVALPEPDKVGGQTFRQVMATRRSVRHFTEEEVSLQDLSQLLWAAQGVTNDRGWRTVPSAGAKFPIELYIVADRVEGLEPGMYHYRPGEHRLGLVRSLATSVKLQTACSNQASVGRAALNVIAVGVVWRVEEKYGPERSERYVVVEGGAVLEHLSLEAHALGLGSVIVGGFSDDDVQSFVNTDTLPIGVLPIGHPAPAP
jgi:SagB-type dehydrogenase family enzyme